MPLNGRRVLAAREGLTADTEAPIFPVAERAVIGISALYLRYEGLRRNIAFMAAVLANEEDAWEAFARFVHHTVDTDTYPLTLRLAGTCAPSEELNRGGERAHGLTGRLLHRTKSAGMLRPDIEASDLALILGQ